MINYDTMKKIIAAFDGLKYSANTADCAVDIAKQTGAHVTGVFLDDFTRTSYTQYDLVKENASEREMRKYEAKDNDTRDEAAIEFETACRQAGVQYNIHRDRNIAIQELLHESIYADLLIIDGKETLGQNEAQMPTGFIRDVLSGAKCPVLLLPGKYSLVKKIIMLYDGSPSSVHAVKMFSYLLPQLALYPTEVLSAKGFYDDLHVPDNRLMKEFMKRHAPKAVYNVLTGRAEKELVNHIKNQHETALLVMGAYDRGRISRWFKESMADVMMRETSLPLFVAHNR